MCILLCRIFILMLTIKILWVVTKLSHLCIRWYFEIRWSIIRKPAFFLTKNKNIQGDTYGYFYIYYWFMLYQGTVVWLHFCVSRTRISSYALKIRVFYASKKRVTTPIIILVSLIIRKVFKSFLKIYLKKKIMNLNESCFFLPISTVRYTRGELTVCSRY